MHFIEVGSRRVAGREAWGGAVDQRPVDCQRGSVAQMVCSRCGSYSAEHKYITVELSCSARKP